MKNELFSKDRYTTVMALYKTTAKDLTDPEILRRLLILLKDSTYLEFVMKEHEKDYREIVDWLEQDKDNKPVDYVRVDESVEPEDFEDYCSECEYGWAEEPTTYYVCSIAEHVLKLAYESDEFRGSEDLLKMLISLVEKKDPRVDVYTIEELIFKLDWEDKGEAFRCFTSAILERDDFHYYIDGVIKNGGREHLSWLVRKLGAMRPPDTRSLFLLRSNYDDGVLEELFETLDLIPGPLGKELLEFLADLAEKDDHRDKAIHLMKRIEREGIGLAAGYIALNDEDSCRRFTQWLEKKDKDTIGLIALADRIKYRKQHPPNKYPVQSMIFNCGPRYAYENMDWFRQVGGDETVILWQLVEQASYPRDALEPLIKLAKRGIFKNDPDGAAKLWENVVAGLTRLDIAPKHTPTAEERLKRWYYNEDHPILVLSDPAIRPIGFEKAILELLAKKKLFPSLALRVLPDWKPDEKAKNVLIEAIKFELARIEQAWKAEQSRDRRAGNSSRVSILSNLETRWEPLRDLIMRINGPLEIIRRMDNLLAINWRSIEE